VVAASTRHRKQIDTQTACVQRFAAGVRPKWHAPCSIPRIPVPPRFRRAEGIGERGKSQVAQMMYPQQQPEPMHGRSAPRGEDSANGRTFSRRIDCDGAGAARGATRGDAINDTRGGEQQRAQRR